VGPPAGHACRDVPTSRAEDEYGPSGHVLECMVTDALDDRGRAGVSDTEAFAHETGDEQLPSGRTVCADISGNDTRLGRKRRGRVRPNDQATSRESLAEV